jgi:hypothetical protein
LGMGAFPLHYTYFNKKRVRVRIMVFNAPFNTISVILWLLVFYVEET